MKSRSKRRSILSVEKLESKRMLSVSGVPTVSITTPVTGQVLAASEILQFSGTSNDVEDGDISAALAWTSSQSGFLGVGATIETSLSAGSHVITARSTDTDGHSEVDSHEVTIVPSGNTSPLLGVRGKSWGTAFGLQGSIRVDDATTISSSTVDQIVAQFDDPQQAFPTLSIDAIGTSAAPFTSLSFWNGKIAVFQLRSGFASGAYLITVSGDTLTNQTLLTIQNGNDTPPEDDSTDGEDETDTEDENDDQTNDGDQDGSDVDPPSVPAGPTTLLAKNRETDVSTDEIDVQIRYINATNSPQNLNGAEVRYYFTPDGLTPVLKVKGSNAEVSAAYQSVGSYASVRVVEDLMLAPGESWQFRLDIENEEQQNFNQANDASFLGNQTNLEQTDAIDLVFATDAPPALELVYTNKERNAVTDVIEGQIELYNREDSVRNFRNMELRYYIDADGLTPDIQITRSNLDASAIQTNYNAVGGYVSFRISEDFSVAPGKRLKLRFAISNNEDDLFDQSNDASFSSNQGPFVSNSIDVWLDGQRLWGG